jgi:hypothetical protein
VQGFAAHPALVAFSQPGLTPKLFHKAALEGDDDSSLAGDVRQALANKKQRVVGIVINAVDDHLDKGDQIDALWTMQQIRVLEPILAEAAAASRMVVLVSDHGHTLDRQTEGREPAEGLRWRKPGGTVTKEELEVTSPRVVLPEGGRVVVPWSERLRYGAKKNGYHGGVTPQEMLIPISMLWPELDLPEGFGELPAELPSWWTEPRVARPAMPAVEPPPRPKKGKLQPPTLFEKMETPVAAPASEEPWIKTLLQSEVFAVQDRGGVLPRAVSHAYRGLARPEHAVRRPDQGPVEQPGHPPAALLHPGRSPVRAMARRREDHRPQAHLAGAARLPADNAGIAGGDADFTERRLRAPVRQPPGGNRGRDSRVCRR